MKFNEWLTQNKPEFEELSQDLNMRTQDQEDLIESQLDQWVNKLVGLLHNLPEERKQKLIEKVVENLRLKF